MQSAGLQESEAPSGRPASGGGSVELSGYLRSRWGILLIAVPVITGAILFAASKPPQRFDAIGIVSATPPDASESSQFSTGPFVEDFRSMLTSTAVEDAVEDALVAAGADPPGPASTSGGLNGGALVEVGITASTPEAAELAVRTAVAESLSALNRQNVQRTEVVAAARAADVEVARSALTDFATENEVQDVEGEYARRSSDLLETRNLVAANPANPALRALLDRKAAELEQYGALLLEWQLLEATLQTAVAENDAASAAHNLALARADSIGERSPVESVTVTEASQLTGRTLAGVLGAAVALVVVVAAMAMVRNAASGRSRRSATPADPDTDAPLSTIANGDQSAERDPASQTSPAAPG